jgi:nicotinate-nucleotide pyrophosphorylase (carboxylating)
MFVCERPLLNLLGHLSGIATLTRKYVGQVAGTNACIYDTRKTTPGWRRLEKYAVRCGGGRNHRTGLFDAVLIKDNHLALGACEGCTPADAVGRARDFLQQSASQRDDEPLLVEIEVDRLEKFDDVLRAGPDIILLDNMPAATLREAVARRNTVAPAVQLEASGGVTLETVRETALTGVERISVGALTHSARALDIGLDWCTPS